MPYEWISPPENTTVELHLWPHQSLTAEGYVGIIGLAMALMTVPLIPILGTVVLWGILPFMLIALWGLKWALDLNRKHAQILEVLILDETDARLTRYGPRGEVQDWQSNRHWVQVHMHISDGPVPHYVTLQGGGREVEIGAFLSEEERQALYSELFALLAIK
ncbi:DUF2244 domain-containing protein [Epibacterium sp. SM1979]|uniref:DUF2244 domain-containing protein n=1 Tax=Tritonibacter litoralis TaxID=2662264 RepID=A0A843YEB7_9RHOB|nr:DUF2244 domain-containing protein [Tritonibacter litoralis]MQQ08005.1 DUF2244 domain-containing protein [Tritonibacter litoralis]